MEKSHENWLYNGTKLSGTKLGTDFYEISMENMSTILIYLTGSIGMVDGSDHLEIHDEWRFQWEDHL